MNSRRRVNSDVMPLFDMAGQEVNAAMRIIIRVYHQLRMKTCIAFSPFLDK
jgi:hypothetical protein